MWSLRTSDVERKISHAAWPMKTTTISAAIGSSIG